MPPQDTDDHWVSLPRNSLALGSPELKTPPNSGATPPPQSVAEAETALANAIRAAAIRANSTLSYLSVNGE